MKDSVNLLAIETTGLKASVALLDKEGRLTYLSSEETMNHLQHLIPMTDRLLTNCGLTIDDVSVIAVSEGPGSFTGIRIGMATAKGLAQVLSVPVVSVPTLQSFAYNAPDYRGLLCPIFDARRSQVYAGVYRWEGEVCRCLVPDGAYDLSEYLELLKGAACLPEEASAGAPIRDAAREALLFGDGIINYGQLIQEEAGFTVKLAEEKVMYQSAASVARLGYELFRDGQEKSLFEAHPVYLRKAEAQRKLEEATERDQTAEDDKRAEGAEAGGSV